jgi:hypothetical protein
VRNKTYEYLTGVPKVAVKADESDQKVTGFPYYDTIAAEVVNASAVEIHREEGREGRGTNTETASSDRNTLNENSPTAPKPAGEQERLPPHE